MLKKHNVKNIITVDPHTTNMMRSVYPKLIKEYDITVKSYMEVLLEKGLQPKNKLDQQRTIHDSCVYTRYENVISEQRSLLENAGIAIKEPSDSGKFTYCCGGPVESLFPKKAKEKATQRIEQLKKACPQGVTMCPICLVNLQKAANGEIKLDDISSYLAQAYL